MKPNITLTLEPRDFVVPHEPNDSPLAMALTRVTGCEFHQAGRILHSVNPLTSHVCYIYDCGDAAVTLWRDWTKQSLALTKNDHIGEVFHAKLLPILNPQELDELGKLRPSTKEFRPYEDKGPIPTR